MFDVHSELSLIFRMSRNNKKLIKKKTISKEVNLVSLGDEFCDFFFFKNEINK